MLTVGVFDLLHFGHFELFRHAKEFVGDGGLLIVAVQDDDSVTRYKSHARLVYDWNTRAKMIQTLRYVDCVVPYDDVDSFVMRTEFDVFAVGGDQNHPCFQRAVKWSEENGRRVVRLSWTDGISSSQLRCGGSQ
ncbi:MAG: adenylyltransferase/cytidyltransferase family protein [Treponema sp.]|nr:adenylyltransferase/cytidyltransferase family protein [Treponema sp.]